PHSILVMMTGGSGGFFFSVRRIGVAGSGRGGTLSADARCAGLGGGGSPHMSRVSRPKLGSTGININAASAVNTTLQILGFLIAILLGSPLARP
ncbi:MAG TPA: hypothetical protein VM223_20050, partial [Planctomycetota bacterium]|nr:hypothetical protein [Planctomycetota bacterium]